MTREATWPPEARRAGRVACQGTGHVEDVESSPRRRRARSLHRCEAPWVSAGCLPSARHACQQGFQTRPRQGGRALCSRQEQPASGGCGPGDREAQEAGPWGAGFPGAPQPAGSSGGARAEHGWPAGLRSLRSKLQVAGETGSQEGEAGRAEPPPRAASLDIAVWGGGDPGTAVEG